MEGQCIIEVWYTFCQTQHRSVGEKTHLCFFFLQQPLLIHCWTRLSLIPLSTSYLFYVIKNSDGRSSYTSCLSRFMVLRIHLSSICVNIVTLCFSSNNVPDLCSFAYLLISPHFVWTKHGYLHCSLHSLQFDSLGLGQDNCFQNIFGTGILNFSF